MAETPLEQAERHIAELEDVIEEQERIVQALWAMGDSKRVALAHDLMRTFRQSLKLASQHREAPRQIAHIDVRNVGEGLSVGAWYVKCIQMRRPAAGTNRLDRHVGLPVVARKMIARESRMPPAAVTKSGPRRRNASRLTRKLEDSVFKSTLLLSCSVVRAAGILDAKKCQQGASRHAHAT